MNIGERLRQARPPHLDPGRPVDPVTRHEELTAVFATTSKTWKVRRRWVWAPTLATVTATAAVAAIALTPGPLSDGLAPHGETTTPTDLSARSILLAAATAAENQPATGKYWMRKLREGSQVMVQPRKNGEPYAVDERYAETWWASASGNDDTWLIRKDEGAQPVTAADRKAWKADGAPDKWKAAVSPGAARRMEDLTKRIDKGDGEPPDAPSVKSRTVDGAAGPAEATNLTKVKGGGPLFVVAGNQTFTAKQLRNLPTDPAGLRADIERRVRNADVPPQKGRTMDDEVWDAGVQIIARLPVPGKVRAAAYRMLADMDEVYAKGHVRDVSGRAGQAVMRVAGGTGERLIVDPETGAPLSVETHGRGLDVWKAKPAPSGKSVTLGRRTLVTQYELIEEAKWTDEKPDLPAKRVEDGEG